MKNKHRIAASLMVVLAIILAMFTISLGNTSTYDVQGLGLLLLRLNIWFVLVVLFSRIKSALEDDDLEEDWGRINAGNVAVAVFRGLEFFGVSVAVGLLISKV